MNGDSDPAPNSDCGCTGSVDSCRFILRYSFGFVQSDAVRAGGYLDRDGNTGGGYGQGYVLSGYLGVGIAPVAFGRATLTTTSLAAGPDALTAYYGGDGGNGPARSAQVPMTVNSIAAQGFQSVSQSAIQSVIALQFPALAVGDFNGDGKLDLAILSGATLAIMLGNGDGTFQTRVNTSVHGERMAAADFDGDGVVDLAVAESAYLTGGVSILLGKGDGTFTAPVSIPVANGSATMAVALSASQPRRLQPRWAGEPVSGDDYTSAPGRDGAAVGCGIRAACDDHHAGFNGAIGNHASEDRLHSGGAVGGCIGGAGEPGAISGEPDSAS